MKKCNACGGDINVLTGDCECTRREYYEGPDMSETVELQNGMHAAEQEPSNVEIVLAARGNRYGDFNGHALITQQLKRTMHDSPRWADLPSAMKEALEMTAHKIGRILNGDPWYKDSWVDIEGYIRLVSQELNDE